MFPKVKEAVEYKYHDLLGTGDIPLAVWRSLVSVPIIKQECQGAIEEVKLQRYEDKHLHNVAYFMQAGLAGFSVGRRRKKFKKPTAERRYQDIALFVRDRFHTAVAGLRLSPKLSRACIDNGFSIQLTPTGFTLSLLPVGGRIVRRYRPNWSKLHEAWVARHPEDKLKAVNSLRVLYGRAYRRIGANPDGQELPNPALTACETVLNFWEGMASEADKLDLNDPEAANYLQHIGPWFEEAKRIAAGIRASLDSAAEVLVFDKAEGVWKAHALMEGEAK